MTSKKNLTRFTYESAAFEGWRLCLSRRGITFIRYFSDKRFGGGKKSLVAADKALRQVKKMLEGAKLGANGKLSPVVVRSVQKYLEKVIPSEEQAVKSSKVVAGEGEHGEVAKKRPVRKTAQVKTLA